MEVIETIKRDKAYIKCKQIVKHWEKEFKVQHSRTPSRFDIKEAPAKIKYAYKKYFQLKSAALENTFSVGDIDEDVIRSPELSVSQLDMPSSFENYSSPLKSPLPELPSGPQLENMLSHKKTKKQITKKSPPVLPFTDNLSKKLFLNKTFSIRNPRKMSLTHSQSSQDSDTLNLTTDNYLHKSYTNISNDLSPECDNYDRISQAMTATNSSTIDGINEVSLVHTPVRQVNTAWLDRVSGVSAPKGLTNTYQDPVEKFGLANIKITTPTVTEATLTDLEYNDFVENSGSEDDEALSKLKPALKKVKMADTLNSSNNNESISQDRHDDTKTSGRRKKSTRPIKKPNEFKRKKDKTESEDIFKPPDVTEYLPFGLEGDITPRHKNVQNVLQSIEVANISVKKRQEEVESNTSKLELKIKSGTLNENFVKINIEKKVFVRGKKNMKYSTYKKKLNKDKKALHAGMEHPEGGKVNCFKCGESGHMARYCTAHRGDKLLPLEGYVESELPTLEDMQIMVSKETTNTTVSEELSLSAYQPSTIPDSFLKLLNNTSNNAIVQPVYTTYTEETPTELMEALQQFGHSSFRQGQEQAIKRILCGMSTLLILSTGGGKSLCYQLPAYIYSKHFKCITLVISPLVSLMEDQVVNMPDFLKAGCLHTNQPPTQRKKIIQLLKDGEINILLISPEALISGDGSNGFSGLFKSLPQIAFACIDEAHCVSQWSHNFRPSYLMICRVLKEKLNVKCILGLTATASQSTIKSVISHIDIPDGISGVITSPTLPDNLYLSASFERDKDRALVAYLTSERISKFNSIIVYCIRRDECVRVAALLRSCLQQVGKPNMEKENKKRKRMSYIAEAYHAGMSGAQRKKIQKHFMDGTLRIIVATVAFGMGINKSNIRCIIHYNMPSSFESYVQEVGRAGRDGQPAYCHVFMSSSANDKNELLKHIYSNSIDRPTIRKLLQKVFIPCECNKLDNDNEVAVPKKCKGHEVGVPIDSTVEELDLPSENIATLLCYVELHPKQYLKVLNNAYTMCKISSYGGPQKILEAAKTCAPLAMAYLIISKKDNKVTSSSVIEFNVIEVAAAIGWESGMTKYHLKNLEWITEAGSSKRSFLKVEFHTLGFRIKANGDLCPNELDNILDDLHETVSSQEKAMLYQLEECHNSFSLIGNYSIQTKELSDHFMKDKSDELKATIRHYFERDSNISTEVVLHERPLDVDRAISDIRALIATYKDCSFTGRSIARIFQGISSPNYPALIWGRCKFWRTHLHEDFYGIMKLATQQVIQMKIL